MIQPRSRQEMKWLLKTQTRLRLLVTDNSASHSRSKASSNGATWSNVRVSRRMCVFDKCARSSNVSGFLPKSKDDNAKGIVKRSKLLILFPDTFIHQQDGKSTHIVCKAFSSSSLLGSVRMQQFEKGLTCFAWSSRSRN